MEMASNAKIPKKRHQGEGNETARRRMAICRAKGARESDRQRMARRAKDEGERARRRQRMAMRHATNVAQERARQLKRRLDDATRKKVDACAALYKRRLLRDFFDSRRLAFDRKKVSEAVMLKKFASFEDVAKLVVMVAEFEISIIEGMAEHGSIGNYLKGLKMAAEFAEGGAEKETENAKPGVSDEADVRAFEGDGDGVSAKEAGDANGRGCNERNTDGLSAKLTDVSITSDNLSCFDSGDQGSITCISMHTTEQYSLDDEINW